VTSGSGHSGRFVKVHATQILGCDRLDELPVLDEETRNAVANALNAVKNLRGVNMAFRVAFSPSDWSGSSCGLAVALAAISLIRQTALRSHLTFTGRISLDGEILEVGGYEEKIELLETTWSRGLLVAARGCPATHPRVYAVSDLQAAVVLAFGELPTVDALERMNTASERGDKIQAAQIAWSLPDDEIERHGDTAKLKVLNTKLAGCNLTANTQDGATVAAQLQAALNARPDTAGDIAHALGTQAVHMINILNFEGLASLRRAKIESFSRSTRPHLLGPLAMHAIAEGRFCDAIELRTQSLSVASDVERVRCLGDLADAQWRAGALSEAQANIVEARKLIRSRPAESARTAPYVELHAMRIELALGHVDSDAAAQRANVGPISSELRGRIELERLKGIGVTLNELEIWWESLLAELTRLPIFIALYESERAIAGDGRAMQRFLNRWPASGTKDANEARRRVPY